MYYQEIKTIYDVAMQYNAWEKLGITPFGPPIVSETGQVLMVGHRAAPLKASRFEEYTPGVDLKPKGEGPVPPEAA